MNTTKMIKNIMYKNFVMIKHRPYLLFISLLYVVMGVATSYGNGSNSVNHGSTYLMIFASYFMISAMCSGWFYRLQLESIYYMVPMDDRERTRYIILESTIGIILSLICYLIYMGIIFISTPHVVSVARKGFFIIGVLYAFLMSSANLSMYKRKNKKVNVKAYKIISVTAGLIIGIGLLIGGFFFVEYAKNYHWLMLEILVPSTMFVIWCIQLVIFIKVDKGYENLDERLRLFDQGLK